MTRMKSPSEYPPPAKREASGLMSDAVCSSVSDADAGDLRAEPDPDVPVLPLGDTERAELFSAISNIVAAYSNNDARVFAEVSKSAWDFMSVRKRHIPLELCAQSLEPIKRVLVDHFCIRRRCSHFSKVAELDAHLALDTELLSFAIAVCLKWNAEIISPHLEGYALQLLALERRVYERESREDLVAVCDKWSAKWQENIDSENGYYRNVVRKCYLHVFDELKDIKAKDLMGAFETEEDARKASYSGIALFGRLYGYTPKWIKEYEPQEAQSGRDSRTPGTPGEFSAE